MKKILRVLLAFLHSQLHGWKLLTAYLVACSLSVGIGYVVYEENILRQHDRQQRQLLKMNETLEIKKAKASDYMPLQTLLDEVSGKKLPCISELENDSRTPDYKAQRENCIGKEAVLQRLTQFNADNSQSSLRVFESPQAVLGILASATRGFELNDVRYRIDSSDTEDFFDIFRLKLDVTTTKEQLLEYIKLLDSVCKNCVVKLTSLNHEDKTQQVSASLRLSLYLDPINPKRDLKEWRQAISDGKLSGKDLASYKQSN